MHFSIGEPYCIGGGCVIRRGNVCRRRLIARRAVLAEVVCLKVNPTWQPAWRRHSRVLLKSIFGLIVGTIGGFIAGFIAAIVVWIVVGIATWDSDTGYQVSNVVMLLCILIGAIVGFVIPLKNESDRQAKLAEHERWKQRADEADLRKRIDHLSELLSSSRSTFLSMRELIPAAGHHLDRAEQEFEEGVFAPFWDEVEHATNKLATYRNGIETINGKAFEYRREAANVTGPVPPFDLPFRELPDGRPTAHRLVAIVRRAQKDFHFATIYEQRKTNKILVAGFGTLASAIYEIGDAISFSLNNLSNTLDELLDATREHSTQATLQATRRGEIEQEILESHERQERMLDNIQRGRKP